MNSFKRVCAFQIELEFESVGFLGKGKYPDKNLSEQGREPTTNSTHIWLGCWDLNPGHIWLEASALTTAPSSGNRICLSFHSILIRDLLPVFHITIKKQN